MYKRQLEEMLENYTPARCAEIGQMLEDGLHELAKKYPLIGEVRGRGLMQGVVFPSAGWGRDLYWSSMDRLTRVFVE